LLLKPLQLVVLGTGQAGFESQLRGWAQRFPDRFGLKLEYDESMAHRIEAGADIFLMPSRFEPCGLNQLYSQRYGTPPVVHRVGGLADTTVDAAEEGGTGFLFDQPSSRAFGQALDRALGCYRQTRVWRRLQRNGMGMDFSWQRSAMAYSALYRQALEERAVQLKPG
ncbi:MAG: glycosyltransferase, partial [Gammaproteobacteria bacterium]|nr:glycosyltransferase [Gammaproteobacteria bacterium]